MKIGKSTNNLHFTEVKCSCKVNAHKRTCSCPCGNSTNALSICTQGDDPFPTTHLFTFSASWNYGINLFLHYPLFDFPHQLPVKCVLALRLIWKKGNLVDTKIYTKHLWLAIFESTYSDFLDSMPFHWVVDHSLNCSHAHTFFNDTVITRCHMK